MKSRNFESRNNKLSHYKEVKADLQVSIEKSRYNELSHNNEVIWVLTEAFTRFHCTMY